MSTMTYRIPTDADMALIKSWLQKEEEDDGQSLIVHWDMLEDGRDKGETLAFIVDQFPVGFVLEGRCGPDIISVAPDYRNRGIGSDIMKVVESRYRERGTSVIEVRCASLDGAALARRAGYLGLKNERAGLRVTMGFKVLDYPLDLPNGPGTDVILRLYPESRGWKDAVAPHFEHGMQARADKDGILRLPQRVALYVKPGYHDCDCILEIEVEGKLIYRDKVKRQRALDLGVQIDTGYNYYIESLNPAAIRETAA